MMWCSSQNIYPKLVNDSLIVITPKQLKSTNLIFLEHKKLKLEKVELIKQVDSYALLTANLAKADSLRKLQLERANMRIKLQDTAIQTQQEQLRKITKKNKRLTTLSTSLGVVTVGVIMALLFK